jgi:predicted nucleotidyltransferase
MGTNVAAIMPSEKSEKMFNEIYEEARRDPNVIGLFLGGSRGKGFETKWSDYDVYIIVKDRVAKSYKSKYARRAHKDFDFAVFGLSGFKRHARLGASDEGYRYGYARIKVLIDKSGKIQKLVNEKGRIPKRRIKRYISGHLDGYINQVYRSLKCFRDGDPIGARLEAAGSIPLLLNILFALHGGRIRPYYKYLKWELDTFPLKKFPVKSKELINGILKILDDADIKTQQKLLNVCERIFRHEGYGKVFDGWGEDLDWMKTFRKSLPR